MKRVRISLFVCLASLAWPAVAAAQSRHYAVVIEGASGEAEFATQHRGWLDSMVKVLREKDGLDADRLIVMAETPGPGEVISTAESVKTVIGKLSGKLTETDVLLVMLIGHGTADATTAKFNLPGPDLDVSEWNTLLKTIKARLVFVNASSASFPYIKSMAGPSRVIITATGSLAEKYHTIFAGAFAQALDAPEADLDKNGRISMWEAFSYAQRLVKQYYDQRGQLQTEHAAMDDNGDGVWKSGNVDDRDGMLASITYLDTKVEAKATDPMLQMLLQQQEDLTLQVEQLKRKKSSMSADDYDKEMERLLIELATLGRDIRKRGGGG